MSGFVDEILEKPRRRPLIGVTGPDQGGWPAWFMTARALRRAGARPVRLKPGSDMPDSIDGLVVGGGADVSPRLYDQDILAPAPAQAREQPWFRRVQSFVIGGVVYALRRAFSLPRHAGPDPARDELELALLSRADLEGLPVLGICRGAQLMNVYGRGNLVQRIDAYEESPQWTVWPRKRVDIDEQTHLRDTLGVDECMVNSLHRQAVGDVASGFRVAARDDHGVIQAIERDDHRWLGVQWHPEYLPQRDEQQRLFADLTASAQSLRARA